MYISRIRIMGMLHLMRSAAVVYKQRITVEKYSKDI